VRESGLGVVEMKTSITSSSSFPSCSMRRCWPSSWLLVFLSLFLCVASSRLSKESLHSSSGTSPHTPLGQAERMIKALNLLPSVAEEDFAPIEGPRLQERRIHLDIRGDPGVTPEELGQYAGYFKLERTHAAKYCTFSTSPNLPLSKLYYWNPSFLSVSIKLVSY
jgi:hypothetical protein